jgi:hypothetical protein
MKRRLELMIAMLFVILAGSVVLADGAQLIQETASGIAAGKEPYPLELKPAITPAKYKNPMWLSRDGKTLYTGLNTRILGKSTDDLETLETIHTFEVPIKGCRDLENGELLVATGKSGVPGALWVSSGGQTAWTKVLECSGENAYFNNSLSLSGSGKIVVASEYGGKTPPGNARRVYLSTDYGVTWKEILDIGPTDNTHIHSCAYDPYDCRIWVSSGDEPHNVISYSDDCGTTWTKISAHLVTSIVPLPDCVLFGTHQPPNGILRYDRKTRGFEYAYRIDEEVRNVTYCASMAFQGQPGGPVYFSFIVAGVGNKPGLVIATKDGESFYEVFRDEVSYAPGKGVLHLLGPTAGGQLIGLLWDGRQPSYSLFKAAAQDWGAATPPAGSAPEKVPSPQILKPSITSVGYNYPTWLSADGNTIYTGWNSKTLKKSTDDMQTLIDIHTFDVYISGCRDLDNGELLVATGNAGGPGALWVSSKQQTEWTKVLVTSSANAFIFNQWSLSAHKNVVVASEYGGKTPPDNARKVYLSRDFGRTWTEILDLGQVPRAHTHGCAFDPFYDRIWVTTGDSPHEAILYSDDWGKTWVTVSREYKVTSIVVLPQCVLFGTDSSPNGVLRYTREGKCIPPVLEVAYRIDESPSLTYCSQLAFQGRQPGAPVYFPYLVSAKTGKNSGLIIATLDGFSFFEVYRASDGYEAQNGFFNLLGPTSSGKLIGLFNDGKQPSRSLFIADAQEWITPTPQ